MIPIGYKLLDFCSNLQNGKSKRLSFKIVSNKEFVKLYFSNKQGYVVFNPEIVVYTDDTDIVVISCKKFCTYKYNTVYIQFLFKEIDMSNVRSF